MTSDAEAGTLTCPECSEACALDAQFCWSCGFPVGAISRVERDPLVGKILPGGYNVLELIGVGGMGRVYRAQQRALGRTVAVKVIHPHLSSEEKSLARFMTEARATSQLNHPNTVSVIDFGQTKEGQPYLVMEFLRGKNLAQVVASEGLLPLRRLLGILHQVLLALGEAHALQIIHRDLKPENVIVEPLRRGGDFVKVVDFGLAKLKADEGSGITMPGIVCGTPDFMAPEQGRGDPIDGRSDLYAVGVVLFWLLCGRLPFEANTPTQVVMMHITMPVPDPREIAPTRSMPEPVLDLMYRALDKEPERRFADAHSFADAVFELMQSLDKGSLRPLGGAPSDAVQAEVPAASHSCANCRRVVPWGKFCLECGSELPRRQRTSSDDQPAVTLPFLGRDDELRWLAELVRKADQRMVLARVVGDHGVGKTRLLREFALRERAMGSRVVLGRPDPYWAEIPGYALARMVEGLLSDLDVAALHAAPRDARTLVLTELLHGEAAEGLAPEVRRRAYARALAWAIERRAARDGAVILVFDDLDRMDGVSVQALRDLLVDPPPVGALLIAAHSHQFKPRWLEEAQSADAFKVLVGLPNPVAKELLRQGLRGRVDLGMAPVTGVMSPLYLDQLMRFTLEGGSDPPTKLADLVAHRVTTLVGPPRACAQAMAVLGEEVSKGVLIEFLAYGGGETTDADHEEAIAELEKAGIVEQAEDGTFSLAHPIFHDVVLLTTPAEARRELHRRAAYLYRDRGAPVEVLAEHTFLGQDIMTALLTLEQAALRASERGDDETATHLLQRGLDLARLEIHRGELDDPLSAVVIFGRKLGETLQGRGMLSDARGVLQEVLDATTPRGKDRAEVLAQLAEVAQRCHQLDEAERLLAQALEIARHADSPEGLVDGLELRLEVVRSLPAVAEI